MFDICFIRVNINRRTCKPFSKAIIFGFPIDPESISIHVHYIFKHRFLDNLLGISDCLGCDKLQKLKF